MTTTIERTLAEVRPVVTAACRRARVPERDVEDVAQEALLDLWRALAASKVPAGAVAAWATTIAKRRAIDHFHRTKRMHLRADVPDVGNAVAGPESAVADADEVDWLLSDLSADERALLERRYGQGIPATVIASELGLKAANVRLRLHRTLARLRGEA